MDLSRHLLGAASGALLAASIVGLATREDGPGPGPAAPGEVLIADFAFDPDPVSVSVGSTLTWTNEDDAAHTVDSSDGTLDSGDIDQDGTFEHTFDAAGTFAYVCDLHPFMTGTVEVTG